MVPLHDFNAPLAAPLPLDDDHPEVPRAADPEPAAADAAEADAAAEPAGPAPAVVAFPIADQTPAAAPMAAMAQGPSEELSAWSRVWNLKLANATRKGSLFLSAKFAFKFEGAEFPASIPSWWLGCSKLSYTVRLHPLRQPQGKSYLELVTPLTATTSDDLFMRLREYSYTTPVRVTRVPLMWRF